MNGSGLRLNRQAVDSLRGVLDGLSPGSSWRSRGRVRVRLPDGRDLTLTVAATDDGAGVMSTASGSATTGWRTAT